MNLMVVVKPKAALFSGKCLGIKKEKSIGDLILPIFTISWEGTSDDYISGEFPGLPSFQLKRSASSMVKKYEKDYRTGSFCIANRSVLEHGQAFKKYLRRDRAMAIDMETITLLTVGLSTKYQEEPYCWFQTIPWYLHGSKQDSV